MQRLYRLIADGRFHSGSELGAALGVTRAAIWKQIKKLQESGVNIISLPGKGYRLTTPVHFIDAQLLNKQRADHLQILVYDRLDSTNTEVKRQLKAGRHEVVVIAEEQTQGRGRRGRQWQSPPAENIYLSFAWPITKGISQLEGLSLAVGLAVYQTLKPYIKTGLGLKWPNDVLVGDRKIAGILIELHGDPADSCHAVIGVGINVNMQANSITIDSAWTSLLIEHQAAVNRNTLIVELLGKLDGILAQLKQDSFAALKSSWERAHLWQDARVELSFAEQVIEGQVLGISATGELEMRVNGERKRFAGGELTLRLKDDSRA